LEGLKSSGMGLAVVTNTVSPLAERILENARLRAFFDVLACADHVPFAKPAPDLVLHACGLLKVAATETWMVGDSRFDREAARSARAHFVGLGLEGDARIDELGELESLLRLANAV
jgi:phosphoglycolate phosphatase/AHBA synthesis associated protein